ncbi:MAG: hypothetical protein ACYTBZ_30320 [Planctomycetota bacterium]|jgi:hypothetical protein
MGKILAILGCLALVLAHAGCGQQNEEISGQPQLESETGGEEVFPEFLVGVWRADKFNWALKFEPDGSILRLEHVLAGKVKIEEEGVYLEGPDAGTFAVFVMGPCEAKYDSNNRQLSVKIVLEKFHMRLPQGDLEGWQEDYFDGPVSEDGKTWTVDLREYSYLEGADPPDPNLVEANPERLIFSKLSPAEIREEDSVQ